MSSLLLMIALMSGDPGQAARPGDAEVRGSSRPVAERVLLADGTQPDGGKKKKKGGEESEEDRA